MAVIVMVAIFMSASSASAEREDGTLDLILTTPITPRNYIWGKMRGLVGFLVLMLSAPILTMAVVAGYTVIGWMMQWPQVRVNDAIVGGKVNHLLLLPEAPLLLTAILVPFVAMCVTLGMSWSLKSKGVLGALVPTVSIVVVASLVLGFCGFQMAANVPFFGPIFNSVSPATSVVMLVNPWLHVYRFPQDTVTARVLLFFSALIAAGVYSGLVYGLLTPMVRGFGQTVRKLTGTG
jgi:ABC-type Na+ efflux pump permease subunit